MKSLLNAKRIIIKVGSSTVIDENGKIRYDQLAQLAESIKKLHDQDREIILVSSGAVGTGRAKLNLHGAITLAEKQACAAIGQGHLMSFYQELFAKNGLMVAQLLLTARDLADRVS